MSGEIADIELVKRAQGRDRDAFDLLVRRYENYAYNLCYRLTGNAADASDVLTDGFTRAWNGLVNFRGDANFRTWMHRIMVNTFLDFRKKAMARPSYSLDQAIEMTDQNLQRQIQDDSPGPADILDTKELQNELQKALMKLPDDRRMLLVLFHFEEHSYEEISEILGLPVGTVKSRLNRARLSLREILTKMRELS
ncbi:MAG: sigma-70 family RNA polymerase sigma factor [Armatimonadota bacterium]